MLCFAKKPDPVFTAILHAALEDTHGMAVDPGTDPADAERYWQAQCPLASKCFRLALPVYAIDRLLVASQDPITVYRITDYQWSEPSTEGSKGHRFPKYPPADDLEEG